MNRGVAHARRRRLQKFPPDINDGASSAGGQARAGGSARPGSDVALPFGCREVAGNARARLLDQIGAREEKAAHAVAAGQPAARHPPARSKRGELAGIAKLRDCHAGRYDEQSDAPVLAARRDQL